MRSLAFIMLLATASMPAHAAQTPLQAYVTGDYDQSVQNFTAATRAFSAALRAAPEDVVLRRRVFETALAAGNITEAVRLARVIARSDDSISSVNQVLVIDAIKKGDWNQAGKIIERMPNIGVDALLIPLLQSWVAAGRQDPEAARVALDPLGRNDSFVAFKTQQRAWLAVIARDWSAAKAAFSVLIKEPSVSVGTTNLLGYAATLSQLGDTDGARALLSLKDDGRTPLRLLEARTTLDQTGRLSPPLQTIQQGLAGALSVLSSELGRENISTPAIDFAQLAHWIAPELVEYHLVLADVLADGGRLSDAVLILDSIARPVSAAIQWDIDLTRARLFIQMKRNDEAQAILTQLMMQKPDRSDTLLTFADLQRGQEKYTEAAQTYTKAIERLSKPFSERDWALFFARALCFERSKNWSAAEADLKQALALRPNDPTLLNFLGYSWLERRENIAEATKMIERAVDLRPGDGAMIDSLGWAYYIAGKYDQALLFLERAIAAVPGDPTVNEHLGDVYWHDGDVIAARHRWYAALDSDPEPEQRARLLKKIDGDKDIPGRS